MAGKQRQKNRFIMPGFACHDANPHKHKIAGNFY